MPEARAEQLETEAAAPSRAPHWAEQVARTHLEGLGYQHLASNYRLRGGELDLVMLAGSMVVVVEVKQRKSARFGHPVEALDARKLARLRQTAQHYAVFVLRKPDARLRLDAVTLLGDDRSFRLEHHENVGWSA